jgi:hypothetical protein
MTKKEARRQKWLEIARGNVERHLVFGPVVGSNYAEAYALAFDALHDVGCPDALELAEEVAHSYAPWSHHATLSKGQ